MDIVNLYVSLVSEFFMLSNITSMVLPGTNNTPPPHLPQNSHSLSTAYYLLKILADIQETNSELNGMKISQDNGLDNFLESVRWRFVDVLANSWLQGTPIYSRHRRIRHLHIYNLRCSPLSFDRGLGSKFSGTLRHPLPCPNRAFPEAAHNRSI